MKRISNAPANQGNAVASRMAKMVSSQVSSSRCTRGSLHVAVGNTCVASLVIIGDHRAGGRRSSARDHHTARIEVVAFEERLRAHALLTILKIHGLVRERTRPQHLIIAKYR